MTTEPLRDVFADLTLRDNGECPQPLRRQEDRRPCGPRAARAAHTAHTAHATAVPAAVPTLATNPRTRGSARPAAEDAVEDATRVVEEGARVPAARLAPFLLSPDLAHAAAAVLAVIDDCESGADPPAPLCRFALVLNKLCVAYDAAARQLDKEVVSRDLIEKSRYICLTGRRDAALALHGLVAASAHLQSLCDRVSSKWMVRFSTPPPRFHALASVDLTRARAAVKLCAETRVESALCVRA